MDESVDSAGQNSADINNYNLEEIQTIQDINFVNQNLGTGFYSEISDKKDSSEANGLNNIESSVEGIQDIGVNSDIPVTEDSSNKTMNTEGDSALFTLTETTPTTTPSVDAHVETPQENLDTTSSAQQEKDSSTSENIDIKVELSQKSDDDNPVSGTEETVIENNIEQSNYVITETSISAEDAVNNPDTSDTSKIVEGIVEEPSTSTSNTEVTAETSQAQAERIEITEVSDTLEVSEEVPYTVLEEEQIPTHLQEESVITTTTESIITEDTDGTVESETVIFMEESIDVNNEFIAEQGQDNELFIVTNDEQDQLELDPLLVESVNKSIKKPRGRKAGTSIPSHVLGVNINSPRSDPVSNGNRKTMKPRLGVKVPCRNLASQIVSKKEIEDELMKHLREKQTQHDKMKSDALFARKLTQRLANKIAPAPTPQKSPVLTKASSPVVVTKITSGSSSASTSTTIKKSITSAIENNSDLLAILEGDDEDNKTDEMKKIDELKIREMEKEIALKQLKDLPNIEPVIANSRYFRMKANPLPPIINSNKATKNPSANKETTTKSDTPIKQKSGNKNDLSPPKLKAEVPSPPLKKQESPVKKFVEVESQLKASMVIKTYSRKRKSNEGLPPVPLPKKPLIINEPKTEINLPVSTPTNAYITKSSRIIKKKVIWDPDEVRTPAKTTTKSNKSAESPSTPKQTSSAAQIVKITDKKLAAEKVAAAVAKAFDKKLSNDKVSEKKIEKKAADNNEKTANKSMNEKATPTTSEKKEATEKKIAIPKKTITPSPKKHKRLTEIDKLLQDEGAVNMLYEVKNTEKTIEGEMQKKKKSKAVISIDKAHKELRNKASELLKDLQENTGEETPSKYLRKKDSPPTLIKEVIPGTISRKKSKDSVRSSVHSPPASPAFPYEASRIIRRHSSSSFSSTDDISEDGVSYKSERSNKKKLAPPSEIPKAKKVKKSTEPLTAQQKTTIKKDMVKNFNTTKTPEIEKVEIPSTVSEEPKSPSKAFTVKRTDQLVTINLNYSNNNYFFTAQILKDLTVMLIKLGKDNHCNTVSILSTGKYYCQGLDYGTLVADSEEVRKKKATELAVCVKDFLRCLLKFPKVLVAGIQGDCVGLGVTMLPLFDVVIASDKANFSMPYGKLGSVSEAGFLLTVPHITNHALASELLFASSKISASEASRYGLVTRLCWPEKYNDELKAMVAKISKQSRQSIEATKKQVRMNLIESTETAINSQTKVLVEHWISEECQKNFVEYKLD